MLNDLEVALEVEVARAGHSTGEATTVLDSVPRRKRRLPSSRTVSVAGILIVLGAVAAALLIAGLAGDDSSRAGGGSSGGSEVEIVDASDFDPAPGDGEEHPDEVGLATDGSPNTAWSTETYGLASIEEATGGEGTGKPGVGLILDAGKPVDGRQLVIHSLQDDWQGEVYAAASGPPDDLEGWGSPIASFDGGDAEQGVDLALDQPARYYLIWVTTAANYGDGYRVEIGSVRLTGD
jgi:serine/threonine-protein kinase